MKKRGKIMDSKILKSLGASKIDPMYFIIILLIFCIALLVIAIVSMGKIKKLTERYEQFMTGQDMKSMEEVITKRFSEIDEMLKNTDKNKEDIRIIYNNMKKTIQKIGVVKYDAFNEMGGKLSFALVLLDGNNNGFVMNAMHSREGCYTYIKEIINGESYIPLGNEEKEALDQALEKSL